MVATAIAAVAVVGSAVAGRKAKKASQRANAAQRKINKLKNAQAKRAFLRNFRQQQAAALVGAVAGGVDIASSGVQGTLASQATQASVGRTEFKQFDVLGGIQTDAFNAQANANFVGSVFGAVGAFASSSGGASFLNQVKPKPPGTT